MTTTDSTGSSLIDALVSDVLAAGGTVKHDGTHTRWEFTVPRKTLDTGTGGVSMTQWAAGSAGYYVKDGRKQVSGVRRVRETMKLWGL